MVGGGGGGDSRYSVHRIELFFRAVSGRAGIV